MTADEEEWEFNREWTPMDANEEEWTRMDGMDGMKKD
jgi:hypothetical protein